MEYLKSGKMYFEKIILRLKGDPKIILINVVVFCFSFILSHARFISEISPLGVALCGAAPGEFIASCFLGQAFGYASSQSLINTLRYVASSVAIRILLLKITKSKSEYGKIWFITPLCVFSVTLLSGLIINVFSQISIKMFFMVLSESSIAGVCSYFFSQSFELFDTDDTSSMSSRQFICLVFSAGVFLVAFSSINFYEVSLSKILVGLLILMLAHSGGEIASAVAGVVGGISVGIYTNSSFDILSLSLSGLLTGVFSPLGTIGCVSSFLLCRFASFFFFSPKTDLFAMSIECAASITLFLALPKNFSVNLKNVLFPAAQKNYAFDFKRELNEKISKASDCLAEISMSVDKVSLQLCKISESNLKEIYCKVQSDVCRNCEKNEYCCEKNFGETYRYFEKISKLFSENKNVTNEDLPKDFSNLCLNTDDFLSSFEKHYRRHKELMRQESEAQSMRNAFRDRMNCAQSALKKLSKDFLSEKTSDAKTALIVKNIMTGYGIKTQSVACVVDEKGVMNIKALCKYYDSDINKNKLLKDIEDVTLRKFELPKVSYLERGITIELSQKPRISVNTGLCRIPGKSTSLCGDQCDFFIQDGVLSVIISDGMGTGGRAAVDSAMSAEYFKKLIKSGFGEDVALKIVNDCMLVKSSYESLSTIDYATIDLFTGKTHLYKAGAAATVIRKNGESTVLEDASLPIGILREIAFSEDKFSLSPSDIIVMMSDGATSNGTEWIKEIIENFNRNNAEDLARMIALKALEKKSGERQDDVTVFAAILS